MKIGPHGGPEPLRAGEARALGRVSESTLQRVWLEKRAGQSAAATPNLDQCQGRLGRPERSPWGSGGTSLAQGPVQRQLCGRQSPGPSSSSGPSLGVRGRKLNVSFCASEKGRCCVCNRPGSIPGPAISPVERNGHPLQYSCLENSMDKGTWWTIVHGVARSWT